MKIIQFASSSSWTGEMAHVFSLTDSLLKRDLDVTLAVRTIKKGREIPLPRAKAKEFAVPKTLELEMDSGFYPVQMRRDIRKLARYIDKEGIDILHCHRGQEHWIAAIAASRSKRKPKILRTRHVNIPLHTHLLNRWLYRKTDQVLATGKVILKRFDEAGFNLSRPVILFHGGVNCEQFKAGRTKESVREEFAVAPDGCLIAAVGHLAKVKGYEYLMRALAKIRNQTPELKCLIVGSGSEQYLNELIELRDGLGLKEDVIFTGFRSDIPEIMAASDFGVLSSISSEGNSRTALELMSTGLAIVATDVGCLPDLVQSGKTGFVVPAKDEHALSEKILDLAEDKSLRDSFGKKAREVIEESYCEDRVAEKMEQLYRKLL